MVISEFARRPRLTSLVAGSATAFVLLIFVFGGALLFNMHTVQQQNRASIMQLEAQDKIIEQEQSNITTLTKQINSLLSTNALSASQAASVEGTVLQYVLQVEIGLQAVCSHLPGCVLPPPPPVAPLPGASTPSH
jgi:hypothetical protein